MDEMVHKSAVYVALRALSAGVSIAFASAFALEWNGRSSRRSLKWKTVVWMYTFRQHLHSVA